MSFIKPIYKLRDWIDKDKLNYQILSGNPNAIDFLIENPNKINWFILSGNPNALKILSQNLDKINYYYLSSNPNPDAIPLLMEKYDKIDSQYKLIEINKPFPENYIDNTAIYQNKNGGKYYTYYNDEVNDKYDTEIQCFPSVFNPNITEDLKPKFSPYYTCLKR